MALIASETCIALAAVGPRRSASSAKGARDMALEDLHDQVFPHMGVSPFEHTHRAAWAPGRLLWNLSNGRVIFSDVNAYYVDLAFQYQALVLRADVFEDLSLDELIEMVALLRGAGERMEPGRPAGLLLGQADGTTIAPDDLLRRELGSGYVSFPVVDIARYEPWTSTAADFISEHSAAVDALLNSWVNESSLLKSRVVDQIVDRDTNPFVYGATFYSPNCTVAVNSQAVIDAAGANRWSLERHQQVESAFLFALLMAVGLQRVALAEDMRRLTSLLRSASSSLRYSLPGELRRLHRVSRERAAVLERLTYYDNIWLSRREYMDDVLLELRRRFLIDRLRGAVATALDQVAEDLAVGFGAHVDVSALLIAAVAILVAVISLVLQLVAN